MTQISILVRYRTEFKILYGMFAFSDQLGKISIRYKRTGHNMNIVRQTACFVVNPITANNFSALFNCTPAGRASDVIQLSWLGLDALSLVGPTGINYWISVVPALQCWSCCLVFICFHLSVK